MFGSMKERLVRIASQAADALGEHAETAKQLAEKYREKYGKTLDTMQLIQLWTILGDLPVVGKHIQAFSVIIVSLKFAASLPDQVARTVTKECLQNPDPMIIVPMEGYTMVLSFSDETDWQCNFYTDDKNVTNLKSLSALKNDNYREITLKNDRYGIERRSYVNRTGLNERYPHAAATPEVGIESAIRTALNTVPGFDLLEYLPGVEEKIDRALEGISRTIVKDIFEKLTTDPALANTALPAPQTPAK